jgi:hypothetical protein
MFQEFFSRSSHLVWPLMGLLLSVAFFIGVLAYVFLGLRDRKHISRLAALPFDTEETSEGPVAIKAGQIGRAS